jgi:hypothetical protein
LNAALNRAGKGKKFPKTPDELWAENKEMPVDQMLAVARSMAKDKTKFDAIMKASKL